MKRLANKVALVTGSTGGIGEATVRRFLQEGASVMAVGRSTAKLKDLNERIGDEARLEVVVADATDEAATEAAVAATIRHFGGLDIVFANAGTEGALKPLDEMTADEFRETFETNVLGVWLCLKYAIPQLRENRSGSIIITASTAGLIGFPGLANYVSSKHGVIGLMKCAALETADFGVRVNAIAPGPIENRMIHSLTDQLAPADPDALEAQIKEMIPLHRYGVNDEVAAMAAFLASSDSAYCTGSVFTLDGGYTAA